MARYLNPQKISLLVLASLYCEASAPSDSSIPLLSFLTTHLIPTPTTDAAAADSLLTLTHFERVLSPHSSPDSSTLYTTFLRRLWALNSLDALHAFFDNLGTLLAPIKPPRPEENEQQQQQQRIRLSRTSPLGVFVRRAQLEWARLQFHDASALWTAFVGYKLPTAGAAGEDEFDENLGAMGVGRLGEGGGLWGVAYGGLGEGGAEGVASGDEVERVLAGLVERLQSEFAFSSLLFGGGMVC